MRCFNRAREHLFQKQIVYEEKSETVFILKEIPHLNVSCACKRESIKGDRECLPFTKQSGNFGSTEDGKAVLACPTSLDR